MIDLHSHLLDNLEKSPKDIVRSLKFAIKRGYQKVVFTPRVTNIKANCIEYDDMVERFNEVKKEMDKQKVNIEVALGAEIQAYKGIEDDLLHCLKQYEEAQYVVLDVSRYRSSIDELAYTLHISGFIPIFTGVERTGYKHLSTHAEKWHASGAKILVTAKNMFGNTIEATRVRQLIRTGQIDFVSSGRNRLFNPFIMLKLSRLYVAGVVGPKYAKQIFSLNARELFNTEEALLID